MARKVDPVRLRPVDDPSTGAAPVVRLVNYATEPAPARGTPVRLGAAPEEPGTRHLLELPDKDEVELRTHQPGVEALYEAVPEAPAQAHAGASAAPVPAGVATDAPRPLPLPWGLFGLAAAAAGALLFMVLKPDPRDDKEQATTAAVRSAETADPPPGRDDEARRLERIESALRGFFAADSVEVMSRLVRHRQRVLPLMRAWYQQRPVYEGGIQFIRNLQMLPHGGRGDFWWAAVTLENGARHEVVLELMDDGTPLVDWETLVCHQPMPWQEFAERHPVGTAMDFRVRVEPVVDANGAAAFRLSAPGGDAVLTGLAPRGGEVERALLAALAGPGGGTASPRRANLILRLRFDNGTAPGAVRIEKVVNQGWIFIGSPATDS